MGPLRVGGCANRGKVRTCEWPRTGARTAFSKSWTFSQYIVFIAYLGGSVRSRPVESGREIGKFGREDVACALWRYSMGQRHTAVFLYTVTLTWNQRLYKIYNIIKTRSSALCSSD